MAVRIFCGRRRNPLRSYAALEPRVEFTECACVDKEYRGRDAPNPCPVVCEERSDEGVPGMGTGLEVKVLRGARW